MKEASDGENSSWGRVAGLQKEGQLGGDVDGDGGEGGVSVIGGNCLATGDGGIGAGGRVLGDAGFGGSVLGDGGCGGSA